MTEPPIPMLVDALRRTLADVYDMAGSIPPGRLAETLAEIMNRCAGAIWTAETGNRDSPPAIEMCLPPSHPAHDDRER